MELDLDLLASIASGGLGRWIEADDGGAQTYVKDEDCIGCLKDLQAFFRDDDSEERPLFFAVSQYNFARSDLVPLIVTYPEEYDVVFNALKVCTFLTMASHDVAEKHAAQQAARMQQVCEAFLARDALAVIVGLLAEPLSRHPKMSENDSALVQLVITFLRNLLVAATPAEGASPAAADSSRRIKGGLVQRLFDDNVLDLLMLMAQHARERPFKSEAPVMVEIFLRLFDGATAEQLLGADEAMAAAQRSAPHASGAATSAHPQQQRRRPAAVPLGAPRLPRPGVGKSVARFGPARQTFSGAVYVRRHVDHSGSVVVRHTPNRTELPGMPAVTDPRRAKAHTLERGAAAAAASTADGAAPAGASDLRALALTVRLNGFMRRFLQEAYTPLLGQVQKELRPGLGVSQLSDAEFESFVRLVTVCTKYVRLGEERRLQRQLAGDRGDRAGQESSGAAAGATGPGTEGEAAASPFACISATLGWDTFHFVQVTWILTSEADSRGAKQKDKAGKAWALQHALAPLLKEMLLALDLARVGGGAADRRAADRLQRRLLHSDLKDSGLLPVVARLIRGYNYRFQPRQHAVDLVEVLHVVLGTLDRLAARSPGGFRVAQEARQAPRRRKPTRGVDPVEAGAASTDAQPGGAEAASAEPTAGEAGHQEAAASAENAPAGEQQQQNEALAGEEAEAAAAGSKPVESERSNAGHAAQQQEEEGEEEQQRRPAFREVAFEADKRLRQELAQPAMLHFYTWLLQGYRTNAPFTNHALVAYLNRIARPAPAGLGLEPMLWQLSVLRLFHTILADKAIRGVPEHAELVQLCSRVTRSVLRRIAPDVYCPRVQQPGDGGHGETLAGEDGAAEEERAAAAAEGEAGRGMAEAAAKMREGCASMMCVELLFWKGPNVAAGLAEEYNWRKVVEPEAQQQRPARGAGGGQLGFASYRAGAGRAGEFTEEQAEQLRAAFERCNGFKDCLDRLVEALGGAFKKAHISRQLKALGLVRGRLTVAQGARAQELYETHADKGPKSRCAVVAEELAAGFTGNQVERHLVQMGVMAGKRRGGGAGGRDADAWEDMLGDDEGGGAGEGGGDSGGEDLGGRRKGSGEPSPPLDASESGSDSESDEADGEQGGVQRGGTAAASPGEQRASGRSPAMPAPPKAEATPSGVDAEMSDAEEEEAAGAGSGRKRKSPMDDAVPGAAAEAEANPERPLPAGQQGPSAAQRASALEALRRKRLGAAAEERDSAKVVVVEVAEAEAKENATSGQKTFSRRRLKRAGDAGTLAPPPLDLDLEDF